MAATAKKQKESNDRFMAYIPPASNDGKEIEFTVLDTTAIHGERTHEMLNEHGKPVPFTFKDKYTPLKIPYKMAIKFAKIPEFEVKDTHGRIIRAVGNKRQGANIELEVNECIANYEELTKEALFNRAVNAGAKVNSTTTKAQLVNFLIAMNGMQLISGDEGEDYSENQAGDDEDIAEGDEAADIGEMDEEEPGDWVSELIEDDE